MDCEAGGSGDFGLSVWDLGGGVPVRANFSTCSCGGVSLRRLVGVSRGGVLDVFCGSDVVLGIVC